MGLFLLPDDILEVIFRNLYVGDRVRLRLVCKSWNSILMQDDRFPPEAPWQILSADIYSKPESYLSEICFKSMSEDRIYKFKLPSFDGHNQGVGWCCGSSRGWLAMAVGPSMNPDIFLWNPLSGATHKLPPVSTLDFFEDCVALEDCTVFSSAIIRVEVFSTGSVELVVAVLFETCRTRRIALCTPRETKWTTMVFSPEANIQYIAKYEDIMFHAAAGHPGKLMLLAKEIFPTETERKTFLSKASLEISLTDCQVRVDTVLIRRNDTNLNFRGDRLRGFHIPERKLHRWRLVESSITGKVLFVDADLQTLVSCPPPGCLVEHFLTMQTTRMSVHDSQEPNDLLVLGDEKRCMANESLFLGETGCISFPVTQGIVPDCIYFAMDSVEIRSGRVSEKKFCIRELGQFFVSRNKLCTKSATCIKSPHSSRIGWFMPQLFMV